MVAGAAGVGGVSLIGGAKRTRRAAVSAASGRIWGGDSSCGAEGRGVGRIAEARGSSASLEADCVAVVERSDDSREMFPTIVRRLSAPAGAVAQHFASECIFLEFDVSLFCRWSIGGVRENVCSSCCGRDDLGKWSASIGEDFDSKQEPISSVRRLGIVSENFGLPALHVSFCKLLDPINERSRFSNTSHTFPIAKSASEHSLSILVLYLMVSILATLS